MPEKIRYEIDPYNRLVVVDGSLSLPRQRRVLEGAFAMGADNSLEYRVKSPAGSPENFPYQVKLQGSWSLTADHHLKFSFDRSAGGLSGDALTIAGDIIDAKGDALLFSVTTKRDENIRTIYVLNISGIWQADEFNRLPFKVKRGGLKNDPLLFEAGWEVNKNNEIVYSYERSQTRKGARSLHTFMLKGRWMAGGKGMFAYELNAKSNSAISFKTSCGICGENYIKYEIGVMLSRHARPVKRVITLFGAWRIKKGSALFFDVKCADGKIYSISFSAEAKLTAQDTVSFRLTGGPDAEDLGLSFELNHKLIKGDGNAFLRVLQSRGESSVLVGAGFNW